MHSGEGHKERKPLYGFYLKNIFHYLLKVQKNIVVINIKTYRMSIRNKKIIIAGGTGFIGQALAARWGRDNHVVILGRQKAKAHNNAGDKEQLSAADEYNITYWRWDGRHTEKHWANELEGCDIVINLAGRSVNCRYTDSNRQEIINSRIDATNTIGQAAPGPVTNQYFMATLRRLTGRTWDIPVPAWLLKIGALMIGTEKELVLKSRWVLPTKLEGSGFVFRYPQVENALRSLVTKKAVY
jgi:NAD dependent epimerase/dehydratase family enzyme